MDLATLIGFIGGVVAVVGTMLLGGHIEPFLSFHGFMIVFVGGFFAVMYTAPMPVFLSALKAAGTAFRNSGHDQAQLIAQMTEFATIVRKEGVMALERQEVKDRFLQKGLQLLVDGADEARLTKYLKAELAAMKARHQARQEVMKAWVELGPAFGMIGTLIGLVEMLGNMSDPSSIGKGMSTALVGTLYGAIAANVFFGPLAAKMKNNTAIEVQYREMVIEGLRAIARGESPRNIQDAMMAVLAPRAQAAMAKG